MNELKRLMQTRRDVMTRIEVLEFQIDDELTKLESLRAERDRVTADIRAHVMSMPIAATCTQLTEDVLDAEVIS